VAGTRTVEATVLDSVGTSPYIFKIDYVAPGYADSTKYHWHDLKGAVVALRLPDGRMAIVYCKANYWITWTLPDFPPVFCLSPAENSQVNVLLTAHKAKLSWITQDTGNPRPVKETYRVLAVLDAVAPTSTK